jgi:hypothetical protein
MSDQATVGLDYFSAVWAFNAHIFEKRFDQNNWQKTTIFCEVVFRGKKTTSQCGNFFNRDVGQKSEAFLSHRLAVFA